jgi:hypothetical protein
LSAFAGRPPCNALIFLNSSKPTKAHLQGAHVGFCGLLSAFVGFPWLSRRTGCIARNTIEDRDHTPQFCSNFVLHGAIATEAATPQSRYPTAPSR